LVTAECPCDTLKGHAANVSGVEIDQMQSRESLRSANSDERAIVLPLRTVHDDLDERLLGDR